MNIEQVPYIPLTQFERDVIALAKVRIERQRRARNEHDEKIARLKLERLLSEGLYGPGEVA